MAKLRITWVKSASGHTQNQKQTIKALGLKKLHQSVEREDSPVVRGMAQKVQHLITVEEVK